MSYVIMYMLTKKCTRVCRPTTQKKTPRELFVFCLYVTITRRRLLCTMNDKNNDGLNDE